jgi:hypothetical protein
MRYLFAFAACCIVSVAFGQHTEEAASHVAPEHHSMKGAHRLTLGLGHTHVSEGVIDGKTEWIVLPSWSLNYDYGVGEKWAIGLQTDVILETFVIASSDGEEFERSRPISLVPVAMFKPGKHFSFIFGVGGEFAREQDFALTRLGVEYGFHLPKNWEVGAALVWDNKWNYYNSWGLAFTVSKIWSRRHH